MLDPNYNYIFFNINNIKHTIYIFINNKSTRSARHRAGGLQGVSWHSVSEGDGAGRRGRQATVSGGRGGHGGVRALEAQREAHRGDAGPVRHRAGVHVGGAAVGEIGDLHVGDAGRDLLRPPVQEHPEKGRPAAGAVADVPRRRTEAAQAGDQRVVEIAACRAGHPRIVGQGGAAVLAPARTHRVSHPVARDARRVEDRRLPVVTDDQHVIGGEPGLGGVELELVRRAAMQFDAEAGPVGSGQMQRVGVAPPLPHGRADGDGRRDLAGVETLDAGSHQAPPGRRGRLGRVQHAAVPPGDVVVGPSAIAAARAARLADLTAHQGKHDARRILHPGQVVGGVERHPAAHEHHEDTAHQHQPEDERDHQLDERMPPLMGRGHHEGAAAMRHSWTRVVTRWVLEPALARESSH